jgi:hypothetical protein
MGINIYIYPKKFYTGFFRYLQAVPAPIKYVNYIFRQAIHKTQQFENPTNCPTPAFHGSLQPFFYLS